MSNRINGDFDPSSIEAFRAAYASQLLEPEDQEIDSYSGLPTELVLNTSPWIQHTGLWKANDGTDKNFRPNQILVPGQESTEEGEDGQAYEDDDAFIQSPEDELGPEEDDTELSEEEINFLVEELLGNSEETDDSEDDSLTDESFSDEEIDTTRENENENEMSDEEIDDLISELENELSSLGE